jgi:hypothetical protein
MAAKNVRQFDGIENVEDFLEIFEAFASDLINQFSTLTTDVKGLRQTLEALAIELKKEENVA